MKVTRRTSAFVVGVVLVAAMLLGLSRCGSTPPSTATTTTFPSDLQLYPRDIATNQATIEVRGTETDPTVDALRLKVFRGGDEVESLTQPTAFAGGVASFDFETTITAELANYEIRLYQVRADRETLAKSAEDVVAGDVFVLNGQSNAVASEVSGSVSDLENPFIRTFGDNPDREPPHPSAPDDYLTIAQDDEWREAVGDELTDPAFIGQLGMNLADRIINDQQVPVAILNTAGPGRPIAQLQRSDDRLDLTTYYGRQLWRMQRAGVVNRVAALVFYQGEADVNPTGFQDYERKYVQLDADMRSDFLGSAPSYFVQIANWDYTEDPADLLRLRDVMRRVNDVPHNRVLSMNNVIDPVVPDDVHHSAQGYANVADRIYPMIDKELYGTRLLGDDVYSPDVERVACSDADCSTITVTFDEHADFAIDAARSPSFQLEGCALSIDGIALTTASEIELTASERLSDSACTGLSYPGPPLGQPAAVSNTNGVGILTFYNEPVMVSG